METAITKRDSIRAAVLATHKPKSVLLEIFGTQIELRQPLMKEVMAAQEDDDRQRSIITILINQGYVPGTDEKVFDDADFEQLANLPFGGDILKIAKGLEQLTDVNFLDKKPG